VNNAGFVLSPLIAAAMTLMLTILVFPAIYRDRSRRVFLLVLFSLELWAVFIFAMRLSRTVEAALVWDRLISACLIAFFAAFFHFCHLYTGSRSRWPIYALYAAAGVGMGIGLFTGLVVRGVTRLEVGYAPQVGPGAYALLGPVQALIIVYVIRLLRAWRREPSIVNSRRLLALAAAGMLPFLGSVADGFTDLPPMGIWANLACCLVCSVVVLRYRLFDIGALARRGLVRVLIGSMIAIPYIAAILVANALLRDRQSLLWIYVVSIVVYAAVLWPVYEWARRSLDRLFNSESYDHLQALRELARGADAFSGSQETSSRLTALIQRALNAASVSLLQPIADGQGLFLVASNGAACSAAGAVVGAESPLIDWFHRHQATLSARTLSVEPLLQNIPQAEKAALNELRAALLAPLLTAHGALTGILVLGPKASPRQYNADDIQLLENLGGEAAMALENAGLYRDAVRARETLEAWLNNLPDVVAIVGRDDVIRFLNKEGADRLGARPGQRSFLGAGPREENRAPRRFTETIRGRDYEIASAPLVEPAGQLSTVFVMRDITERRQEQEERARLEARARLASRLASIGEMASGIAHEINNPLTAVIGYSQLLTGDLPPEDVQEAVRQIRQGATRVAGIVQRLLTFARQRKPQRAAVDLNEVILSTIALRGYAMRTGNIRVTAELDPALPRTVADGQQMQQVLLNLIVNAEIAMTSARASGELRLVSERQGESIHLLVKDDGPGVPLEIQERIFDPFFTTRVQGQGTGLGLSICHGIVSEHGGRIWVTSDGAHGSEFHLLIPIVVDESPPGETPAPRKEPPGPRTRVLVVDDEPSIRDLLKAILQPIGHEVDDVADGRSAIEHVKANRYGVILLDVRMPDMGGVEVFQRLKEFAGSIATRVIFMTGDMMADETRAVLEQTGAPALAKPFEPADLLQAIEKVLKATRLRRPSA
jgi:signal transduction histidine kinase/ActR/RegA family two-component response regulator